MIDGGHIWVKDEMVSDGEILCFECTVCKFCHAYHIKTLIVKDDTTSQAYAFLGESNFIPKEVEEFADTKYSCNNLIIRQLLK